MEITFKRIQENDCDLLFKWVNDESVRKNSFNSRPITYEDHKKWFNNKLKSNNSLIYICYINGNAVGQIRIDIEEEIGFIDYSIDDNYRGKGYGTQLLIKVLEELVYSSIKIKKIIGRVKYENIASQRAFEKSGYVCDRKEDYVEYVMYLKDESIEQENSDEPTY